MPGTNLAHLCSVCQVGWGVLCSISTAHLFSRRNVYLEFIGLLYLFYFKFKENKLQYLLF